MWPDGTGSKKKCSQCHSITYFGEECQRQDLERHKDNCIPVVLTETTGKGRGLVASRDIQIGQVILKEQSVVSVYDDERNWAQRSSCTLVNWKEVRILKTESKHNGWDARKEKKDSATIVLRTRILTQSQYISSWTSASWITLVLQMLSRHWKVKKKTKL